MARILPASRKAQRLCIDVAPGFARERVVLTLTSRDRIGEHRHLETLLTSLEARQLGHALLDALGGRKREWPVRVQLAYGHDPDRRFDVDVSDHPQERVVITLLLGPANSETSFAMQLAHDEAHQLGHYFLAAANPSRLASYDD